MQNYYVSVCGIHAGRLGVQGDQSILQGKQDQVGVAPKVEGLHDVVFVELHSLLAQVQETGDLLHGSPLTEQLNNLLLSRGHFLRELPCSGFRFNPVFSSQLGR